MRIRERVHPRPASIRMDRPLDVVRYGECQRAPAGDGQAPSGRRRVGRAASVTRSEHGGQAEAGRVPGQTQGLHLDRFGERPPDPRV